MLRLVETILLQSRTRFVFSSVPGITPPIYACCVAEGAGALVNPGFQIRYTGHGH
ncbi:MAG: hypothetical protein HY868_02115 [Chloroflexi bacterium]|nr:hypothetical protein [Chloroflexota bacterium]